MTTFIPVTVDDVRQRGWRELDIIFVSGDAYIDHPAFGVPLLARWLESHGFRVGIISQPDWRSKEPFMVLGRPRLFFAVSAGAMDSMVAHYTPARKLRRDDAYTPGNRHGARPNRATIIYTSRLKEAYKDVPVVIGGIEASLRRFAHYDYWEDKLRRSILLDAKGDLLIYGMAERAILELAKKMQAGEDIADIRDISGTAWLSRTLPEMAENALLELPSFEELLADKAKFAKAFLLSSLEQNPFSGRTLVQKHAERFLVCNRPSLPLGEAEMDQIYALPFKKLPHPSYSEQIPAWEQIKASITSHRGCFGGCSFCAIGMHQGKLIQSRSEDSIIAEVKELSTHAWFKGSISDVGGPTANMYGLSCGNFEACKSCRRESCIFPNICKNLITEDKAAVRLLSKISAERGIKHVAVSSGVRYDLMEKQPGYFKKLVANHVSGLLKVAPEHLSDHITTLMHKPGKREFERFLTRFRDESVKLGKKQYVIPYLISGHPGCTLKDMVELALTLKKLALAVDQVQDFTPTPGTLSTCMYYSGIDPRNGKKLYVARSDREKGLQKAVLLWHKPDEKAKALEAIREAGREDAVLALFGVRPAEPNGAKKKWKGIKKTR